LLKGRTKTKEAKRNQKKKACKNRQLNPGGKKRFSGSLFFLLARKEEDERFAIKATVFFVHTSLLDQIAAARKASFFFLAWILREGFREQTCCHRARGGS
jgi:hypothetical protein